MCATCHTMKAAGSKGNVKGPESRHIKTDRCSSKRYCNSRIRAMPAFGEDGLLTPEEIDTVSIYVAKNAGK